MATAGFESATPGGEQAQTYAVGIGPLDYVTLTIEFQLRVKFLKLLFTLFSPYFCFYLLRSCADLKPR